MAYSIVIRVNLKIGMVSCHGKPTNIPREWHNKISLIDFCTVDCKVNEP